MRFKSMLLALLFATALIAAPTLAQPEPWSVLLINTTSSDLVPAGLWSGFTVHAYHFNMALELLASASPQL